MYGAHDGHFWISAHRPIAAFLLHTVKGSTLNIVWAGDDHKSTFPWSWLRENCYSDAALNQNANDMTTLTLAPGAPIPTTDYAQLMDPEDDQGLFQLLHQVVENGLAVVENTPSEHGQVKKVAERIAPVSHSYVAFALCLPWRYAVSARSLVLALIQQC